MNMKGDVYKQNILQCRIWSQNCISISENWELNPICMLPNGSSHYSPQNFHCSSYSELLTYFFWTELRLCSRLL